MALGYSRLAYRGWGSTLRVEAECLPCIAQVRAREISLLESGRQAVNHVREVMKLLAERGSSGVLVTRLATWSFRLVKKLTGVEDPYAAVKARANRAGARLARLAEELLQHIDDSRERVMLCCRLSATANSIDFGVAGYSFSLKSLEEQMWSSKLAIDDSGRLFEDVVEVGEACMLLDNAGEAIIDALLARELRGLGVRVKAVVKSKPFQNDITVREFLELGLDRWFDSYIATGSDASSLIPGEVDESVVHEVWSTPVIIAKGMAHYETLSDPAAAPPARVYFILKAKCAPIARSLGVDPGGLVVKLQE